MSRDDEGRHPPTLRHEHESDCADGSMRGRPAPSLVIKLELESRPRVLVDAATDNDFLRLRDWIRSRADLGAMTDVAIRAFLDGKRAA